MLEIWFFIYLMDLSCEILYSLPGRSLEIYLSGAFLYHFLGGAPTSICQFFHPSVHLSVHLSVAHHISGTIHHLIVIFGTHM